MEVDIEYVELFEDKKPPEEIVWTDPVPIVLVGNEYHCYIYDEITAPFNYSKFCLLLYTVAKDKTIILHLNTPGGDIDSVFSIIDAMKACKAPISAILSGTVASGGTMLTMYADTIVVSPFVSFMIHYYSSVSSGKGNEIRDRVKFTEAQLTLAYNEIYKGFLTRKEVKDIIDGKDMWLCVTEVLDRWEKKVQHV